jgi:hypothetical protein
MGLFSRKNHPLYGVARNEIGLLKKPKKDA